MTKAGLLELLKEVPNDAPVYIIVDQESENEVVPGDVHVIRSVGFKPEIGFYIETSSE